MNIAIKKIKGKEIQTILQILKSAKKDLSNIEIAEEIIRMKLFPKNKNSAKSRISRTLKYLTNLDLVTINRIGKTNFYQLSQHFSSNFYPLEKQYSDTYWISSYPSDMIYSKPRVSIYGLPEDFKKKDKMWGKKSYHRIMYIENEIKKYVDEIKEIKKTYRKEFIKEEFNRRLKTLKGSKVKTFAKKYSEVLIHFLNYTDWDKESILKNLPFPSGWRKIEFNKDKEKLIKLLSKKERELSDKNLREKYSGYIIKKGKKKGKWHETEGTIMTIYGMELWKYPDFYEKINKLTELEIKKLSKILNNILKKVQKLYPTRVSIVAHTMNSLVVDSNVRKFNKEV